MTMLLYERQEDFLEKLGTLEVTTPVFMTVVHAKQNETHVAVVRIQFPDSTGGFFHTYNYGEDIHPIDVLDMDVVSVMPSDELKKQMMEKYQADVDKLNKEVELEYEKVKQGLIKMGYAKIINGYSL